MDDLAELNWGSPAPNEQRNPSPMNNSSPFATLSSYPGQPFRPSPFSAQSPAPTMPKTAPKAPASGNDSFANLVSFGSSKKSLSLAERQKQLTEKRAQEHAALRDRLNAQYSESNAAIWDSFEKRTEIMKVPPSKVQPAEHEDDILAAFNAAAPVDASTNFPVPDASPSTSASATATNTPAINTPTPSIPKVGSNILGSDDDIFGLGQMQPKAIQQTSPPVNDDDDDDILGDLAKPVSEFRKPREVSAELVSEEQKTRSSSVSIADKALAELVDMGFPAERARRALSATETGTDVHVAVGLLLDQAHTESRNKASGSSRQPDRVSRPRSQEHLRRDVNHTMPPVRITHGNKASTPKEKDAAQLASELGSSFLKSANSFWKSSSKKMQQAFSEFNGPTDPSQPKWMREATASNEFEEQVRRQQSRNAHREPQAPSHDLMTDEALMLEAQPPRLQKPSITREESVLPSRSENFNDRSSANQSKKSEASTFQQNPFLAQRRQDSRSRLDKLATDEQAAQAYVSPARRSRRAAKPSIPPSEVDLLKGFPTESKKTSPSSQPAADSLSSKPPSRPSPTLHPNPPPRSIPPVSPSALASSHQLRQKGSEAYKRGDYAAAHSYYSNALSLLPGGHPVTIIILSNRALTSLKIGDPKASIADADSALSVIGPSRGDSETIELGTDEKPKSMKEFFGKALMRKAEALEQLERWKDAAKIWHDAVTVGFGGNTSIQGRNRCEKAAGIKQARNPFVAAVPTNRPTTQKKAPTHVRLETTVSTKPAEAVNRFRAANDAADRTDTEKFALSEQVGKILNTWTNGKKDNLRALLASLDSVLWPEVGWKKVGLSELLMVNKVKINYMKAIGKVHPDKVCLFTNCFSLSLLMLSIDQC